MLSAFVHTPTFPASGKLLSVASMTFLRSNVTMNLFPVNTTQRMPYAGRDLRVRGAPLPVFVAFQPGGVLPVSAESKLMFSAFAVNANAGDHERRIHSG
jgi:hypothetical protein